jgi:hypothetical protein
MEARAKTYMRGIPLLKFPVARSVVGTKGRQSGIPNISPITMGEFPRSRRLTTLFLSSFPICISQ